MAIYTHVSLILSPLRKYQCLTVKPFERVVDWVVVGRVTGVAKPLFTGCTAFRAARLRRAWLKCKANRRDAMMEEVEGKWGAMQDWGAWTVCRIQSWRVD